MGFASGDVVKHGYGRFVLNEVEQGLSYVRETTNEDQATLRGPDVVDEYLPA